MIFSKKAGSLSALEAELVRLKALYVKALKINNQETVKSLRKTIKLLKTKMTIYKR